MAISRPSQATASRRLGKLSSPSITNSTICPSQAVASWKEKMLRRDTSELLPNTIPATSTARKPLPPSTAASPKATRQKAWASSG
ncbi:MAG: hypothetical protein QUV07_13610 [Cyanobium sp. CZS 25K]|nr:hypothetical protein [Cyanobium sp. CZS25K]